MLSIILEILKDTKQHWGTPGGVEKMPRDIRRKKGSFLFLFSGNKGHQEDIK
jgi:hypothetical protein